MPLGAAGRLGLGFDSGFDLPGFWPTRVLTYPGFDLPGFWSAVCCWVPLGTAGHCWVPLGTFVLIWQLVAISPKTFGHFFLNNYFQRACLRFRDNFVQCNMSLKMCSFLWNKTKTFSDFYKKEYHYWVFKSCGYNILELVVILFFKLKVCTFCCLCFSSLYFMSDSYIFNKIKFLSTPHFIKFKFKFKKF